MNYQHLYYPNKHITEDQFMKLPLTERINWKKVWDSNDEDTDETDIIDTAINIATFLSEDTSEENSSDPFEGFGGGDGGGGGADSDW